MATPSRPDPNPASAKEPAEGSRDHVAADASDAVEARVDEPSNLRKDPDEWKTGDERMTDAQKSYLKTMSDEAGEPFDDTLTKAEASKRIDELQKRTGRGDSGA